MPAPLLPHNQDNSGISAVACDYGFQWSTKPTTFYRLPGSLGHQKSV